MANLEISQIQLPSGNTYKFKDADAREAIAALEGGSYFLGVTTSNVTDGSTINPVIVDGKSVTAVNGNMVIKGSSEFVWSGPSETGHWVQFGDLTTLGALAYKDTVTLNKTKDTVLGEGTTFTTSASSVSFAAHATDTVLGSDATFTTTVTPTTTNIKATASGTAVGPNGTVSAVTGYGSPVTDKVLGSDATFTTTVTPTTTNIKATASGTAVSTTASDAFVKSYPGATSKLVTTSVPNVTGNTTVSIPNVTGNTSVTANKSTWTFSIGTGTDAETLIIGGGNGSDVTATNTTLGTNLTATNTTLGTAITCATGGLAANGGGSSVMTGLGTPTTGTAVGSVSVSAQPTIALATGATAGSGVVSVATGITSATTSTYNKDEVLALTGLGNASTETVLTGVKVTSQPTIGLSTGASAGTGVISVATGITSATTTTNNKDQVTALTGLGAATAAAQTITVGTNDKVDVATYDSLSTSVS